MLFRSAPAAWICPAFDNPARRVLRPDGWADAVASLLEALVSPQDLLVLDAPGRDEIDALRARAAYPTLSRLMLVVSPAGSTPGANATALARAIASDPARVIQRGLAGLTLAGGAPAAAGAGVCGVRLCAGELRLVRAVTPVPDGPWASADVALTMGVVQAAVARALRAHTFALAGPATLNGARQDLFKALRELVARELLCELSTGVPGLVELSLDREDRVSAALEVRPLGVVGVMRVEVTGPPLSG